MRTLGVDLSADPKKTAVCAIDWSSSTAVLLPRPMSDATIVAESLRSDMVAIDVPLGWPDAFLDAVNSHRHGGQWPIDAEPPADRRPLRFRITDEHVIGLGARPLSVSTDRIGVAAMRGARLQQLLSDAGVVVDRSGMSGQIAEVYPAAALRAWGLPSSGYKGKTPSSARNALVTAIARSLSDELRAAVGLLALGADDDDLDAFICAVLARAVVRGCTAAPAPDQVAAARREGWIHVPTVPLTEIVRS